MPIELKRMLMYGKGFCLLDVYEWIMNKQLESRQCQILNQFFDVEYHMAFKSSQRG